MPRADYTTGKVDVDLQRTIEVLLGDRPIAYHATLARALNSATAGILLSQLLYWLPRSQDHDGWVWKTQEQIYEETALTRWEQETARRILRQAGILEERRAGVPAKLHFRVSISALTLVLGTFAAGRSSAGGSAPATPPSGPGAPSIAAQHVEKPHTSLRDRYTQARGHAADLSAPNPPPNSETTPETTPETTKESTLSKTRKPAIEERRAPQERMDAGSSDGRPRTRSGGRRPPYEADRQLLVNYIDDFAHEFGDRASVTASTTRAVNLLHESGLSPEEFIRCLYEARAITKERTASIQSTSHDPRRMAPTKVKMPYFFAVLEDRLGLRGTTAAEAGAVRPTRSTPPVEPGGSDSIEGDRATVSMSIAPPDAPSTHPANTRTPTVDGADAQRRPLALPPGAAAGLAGRWQAAIDELAATMTTDNYERWIAPLALVEFGHGRAVVGVGNAMVASYVQSRLSLVVARALGVEQLEVRLLGHA